MSQEVYLNLTIWRGIKRIHPGKRMSCMICKESIESGQDVFTIWFKGTEPRDYHANCIKAMTIMLGRLLLEEN